LDYLFLLLIVNDDSEDVWVARSRCLLFFCLSSRCSFCLLVDDYAEDVRVARSRDIFLELGDFFHDSWPDEGGLDDGRSGECTRDEDLVDGAARAEGVRETKVPCVGNGQKQRKGKDSLHVDKTLRYF
jgi:hypothetical protein